MSIHASVGNGGANQKGDVFYVQFLLADLQSRSGVPPIKIDGIVGPKTIGAIHSFQQKIGAVNDGRIDPNRATIRALEQQHISGIFSNIEIKLPQLFQATAYTRSTNLARVEVDKLSLIRQYLETLREQLE